MEYLKTTLPSLESGVLSFKYIGLKWLSSSLNQQHSVNALFENIIKSMAIIKHNTKTNNMINKNSINLTTPAHTTSLSFSFPYKYTWRPKLKNANMQISLQPHPFSLSPFLSVSLLLSLALPLSPGCTYAEVCK